jgi:hypothetical protein
MTTYFDLIPEELIKYVIFSYLDHTSMIDLISVLNEDFNMRLLSTSSSELIEKYKPTNITWSQITTIFVDLELTKDEEERLKFSDIMESLGFFMKHDLSQATVPLFKMKVKYPKELSEFMFKIYTKLDSEISDKINLIIHILGNNNPWYYLYKNIIQIKSDYEHLQDDDEDQQEYSDDEVEKIEKDRKIYEDRVDLFYNYVTANVISDKNISLGNVSVKRLPILLVYLYYMEQLILFDKPVDPKQANAIAKVMISKLSIKLDNKQTNYDFLIYTFNHAKDLKRTLFLIK